MLKQQNEITEAQKKVIASLTYPRLHFAPKSAEQLVAQKKAAEEEEQAEAIAKAKVGDTMPDGSIYAGISPDTKQRMYVTDEDAKSKNGFFGKIFNFDKKQLTMSIGKATQYARDLSAHGHKDWHVPTKEELNVLFQNRAKGALKGTFNLTGLNPSGWYWSSERVATDATWCQQFSDGKQGFNHFRDDVCSVRCVR